MNNNDIDFCLHNHIVFEFGGSGELFESHGYYDKITDITDSIANAILNDLIRTKDDPFILHKTYNDMSIFNGIDPFFDNFIVNVDIEYSTNFKQNVVTASYDSINSKIYVCDEIISFCPRIKINGRGYSKMDIINIIIYKLGHEFTHAYNDYMVYIKSGYKKRLTDLYDMSSINRSMIIPKDLIEYAIGSTLYMSSQAELNAFIAQLKNELEQYNGPFNTSSDFTKAIMSTNAYKNIKNVTDFCNSIEDEVNKPGELSDKIKDMFVSTLNKVSGKSFKNFIPAFKWFKYKVYEINSKFNKKSPKIIHDVYVERNASKHIDPDLSNLERITKRIQRVFNKK